MNNRGGGWITNPHHRLRAGSDVLFSFSYSFVPISSQSIPGRHTGIVVNILYANHLRLHTSRNIS